MIKYDCFAGGKRHCMTFSYDDGSKNDIRLIEIFNKYGLRGTFHLNSGNIGVGNCVTADDVAEIYKNHEVSSHGVNHPYMRNHPRGEIIQQYFDDRRTLEQLSGQIVRGMSYPFGDFDDAGVEALRGIGMCYGRTTRSTGGFMVPDDFMRWQPTTHHANEQLFELLEKFLPQMKYRPLPLFYIWGHAHEFKTEEDWARMEEFCKQASGHEDVWYATNIEIYDYVMAMRGLITSVDARTIFNPSAIDVYVSVDEEAVCIPAGQTIRL